MLNWRTFLAGLFALGLGIKYTPECKNAESGEVYKKDADKNISRELKLKLAGLMLNMQRAAEDKKIILDGPFFEKIREAGELTYKISEAIRERERDIERLADEYYQMFRCKADAGSGEADYWRRKIKLKAIDAEVLYGERNDPAILVQELKKFRNSRLDTKEDFSTIGHHIAEARYFERCLGEATGNDPSGLFDMYQDYRRAKFARECEEAAILAGAIGFMDERFDAVLTCVPQSVANYGTALRENFRKFLEDVETIDETSLSLSARYLGYEQQKEWVRACTTNRNRTHIYSIEEAKANCFADIVRAYDRGGFVPFLDFEIGEIARMSAVLNESGLMSESACYLDAYLFGSGRNYILPSFPDAAADRLDYLRLCLDYTRF